ncbi:MAG: alanine--tRNA ligase [Planctomycetes bacterium]|nr:alanine--tRNA ligase [Planctomycetota bacterium]
MKTDEIRSRFLEFFRELGHTVLPPDSLVPSHDPTLLFTGAGMNQFKDQFYGHGDPSLKRAVTCQKCLRTGDIEQVGRTASHHTFFEMLGNFSFGDYFKPEAIEWAWEFMRREMGIPAEDMVVSIFEDDGEADKIWKEVAGLPAERIFRFGDGENFWPPYARTQGPNGPCGPCSEIYIDLGGGCGKPSCDPSCDCGRYVEVWNLVFQQYDRKEGEVLQPLPKRNIDTGMGLERMARILQGGESNFDIDLFEPLLAKIKGICGPGAGADPEAASKLRRIADHVRAIVFCIADGVMPSNEERGYVVRRLLRRAVRDAHQLGVERPFMTELVGPVVRAYNEPYPELEESRSHIETVIGQEEEAFQKTVNRGSQVLQGHVANLKRQRGAVLRGKEAFDLYQTYGFPLEMTESILAEQQMGVDVQGFLQEMAAHQSLSKSASGFEGGVFVSGPLDGLKSQAQPTEFTGYRTLESIAQVVGIICGDELVASLEQGREAAVVLDRTPAYAEAGGQTGDCGWIIADEGEARFEFVDVHEEKGFYLHVGRMKSGTLKAGDSVLCRVDRPVRMATARNHTATHLLQYALRQVLGEHVRQSGSHVSARRLRFDFSHPTEVGEENLRKVEDIVNQKILDNDPVATGRMSLDEARKAGAIALFGEKYGDIVRVVAIGDYSRELCAGVHCERTGEVGMLRITRESSVAGGVRRIEAVTGLEALRLLRRREAQIEQLCRTLHTQEPDLLSRADEVLAEIRTLQKSLQQQKERAARSMASGSLIDRAEQCGDIKLIVAEMPGSHAELRSAADVIRSENERTVCVLASADGGDVALVVGVSADLLERGLSAREIARGAAQTIGGGGGGRDDLAQAGGPHADKLAEALEDTRKLVRQKAGSDREA